jgi:hypothetical protein
LVDRELVTTLCDEIERSFEELGTLEANLQKWPPGNLYHYTSPEGFIGIAQTGEVWATNVLYSNDSSELSEAVSILNSEIEATNFKLLENGEFFLRLTGAFVNDVPLDHFIVSFCEEGDLLSQWRGYGSQGGGFSIGVLPATLFRAARCSENTFRGGCTLQRVKYTLPEKKALLRKRIDILCELLAPNAEKLEPTDEDDYLALRRLTLQIASSLHPTLSLMKNAKFSEEGEWRLVRTLWKPAVPTQVGAEDWPVRIRSIGAKLAPYLPIPWTLPDRDPVLDGNAGIGDVYCGPSANPILKNKAAGDLLRASRCWSVRVLDSTVPLRA